VTPLPISPRRWTIGVTDGKLPGTYGYCDVRPLTACYLFLSKLTANLLS